MSPRRPVWLAGLFALSIFLGVAGDALGGTVLGRVVYRTGQGIPGLTVSLVHPTAGRSLPAKTDADGHFVIPNVPDEQGPYYLEIYWGSTLKYRKALAVTTPRVEVADIAL